MSDQVDVIRVVNRLRKLGGKQEIAWNHIPSSLDGAEQGDVVIRAVQFHRVKNFCAKFEEDRLRKAARIKVAKPVCITESFSGDPKFHQRVK